jgi:hypothetical protein
MDNNSNDTIPGYIERVIGSDAARKGVVALATGILFAAVSEAIWPSK